MNSVFKQQLEINKPLTKDNIKKLKNKKYHSGKNITENDTMLFVWKKEINDLNNEVDMTLVEISSDEINLYDYDETTINNFIPTLK